MKKPKNEEEIDTQVEVTMSENDGIEEVKETIKIVENGNKKKKKKNGSEENISEGGDMMETVEKKKKKNGSEENLSEGGDMMEKVEKKKKKGKNGSEIEEVLEEKIVENGDKKKKKKNGSEENISEGGDMVEKVEKKKRKREEESKGENSKKKRKKNVEMVEEVEDKETPINEVKNNCTVDLMGLKWRSYINKHLKNAPNNQLSINDLKKNIIENIISEIEPQISSIFDEKINSNPRYTINGEQISLTPNT